MAKLVAHIERGECTIRAKDLYELRVKKLASSRHSLSKDWNDTGPTFLQILEEPTNTRDSSWAAKDWAQSSNMPATDKLPGLAGLAAEPDGFSLVSSFGDWDSVFARNEPVVKNNPFQGSEIRGKGKNSPDQDASQHYCPYSKRFVCPKDGCT